MAKYMRLLRIHQWIKNLFILLPVFFGQKIQDTTLYLDLVLGFLSFSLVASSIYIINDCRDLEEDRLHPQKCQRPIAAGVISPSKALVICAMLIICGGAIAYLLTSMFFVVVLGYFTMNICYSYKLKHIALVDITTIATGFLLRIISGGIIGQVYISQWILLMTFLLALFLGLAKRRDDVVIYQKTEQKMRKAIDGYNLEFINAAMVMMGAVTIVAYIMYTVSPEVTNRIGSNYVYLSSFFVIIGVLRYLQISFVENNSASPTKILLRDTFIQFTILAWLAVFFALLYI